MKRIDHMKEVFNFRLVQAFSFFALALLLFTISQPLPAAEVRQGVVNIFEVFRQLELDKQVQKKLKPLQNKYKKQLESKFKEFNGLKNKLEKSRNTMSAIDLARETRKLKSMEAQLQFEKDTAEKEIRQRGDEETQLIISQKIIYHLGRFAQEKKYDLILRSESVIYSSSLINITDQLVEYIKKKE